MIYRVQIIHSFYHTEDRFVDTYLVEMPIPGCGESALETLVSDAVDALKSRNEDRATFDYEITKHAPPSVLTFDKLRDHFAAEYLEKTECEADD